MRVHRATAVACATAALVLALAGTALAEGDVCISVDGDVKMDDGPSSCSSIEGGVAVAVNDSVAVADSGTPGNPMRGIAVNGSTAIANGYTDNSALAVNESWANAWDTGDEAEWVGGATSTAINGSYSDVSNGSSGFAVNDSEAFADDGGAACAINGESVDDTAGTGDGCP